jgi:energy-coupling factor transport system ATP-binding protein
VAIVEIEQLTYRYPTGSEPALRDITLQVQEGEFVAITGANGAGKSSLCYAMSGFIPHFFKGELQGTLRIAGIDSQSSSLNQIVQNVGLAFQNPFNQISGAKYTVYEEIAFGLENTGVPRPEMRRRIDGILELTGIQDLAERSPFALSGGQQQRVALASILVMQPKLLVLDEPTSQLDPIGTREVFQVVKNLTQEGMTIVMAEHKIEWVAKFADRVLVLDQGEIIRQGSPAEVLSIPDLQPLGVGLARYTLAAQQAAQLDLWPAAVRFPITLDEAQLGFAQALDAQDSKSTPHNQGGDPS